MYTRLFFAYAVIFLLVSCTSEDFSSETEIQSEFSEAELYLSTHDIPAILFSYNVINTDTKVLNSFLVDDEGKIRTYKSEAEDLEDMSNSSADRLQLLKENSPVFKDQSVSIEELVQNFQLMRNTEFLEYDTSVEKDGPQILTAAYAFYYNVPFTSTYSSTSTSTTSGASCQHGGSNSSYSALDTGDGSFKSILLEQKLAHDIIQQNPTTKFTIEWLTTLVNTSDMELTDN